MNENSRLLFEIVKFLLDCGANMTNFIMIFTNCDFLNKKKVLAQYLTDLRKDQNMAAILNFCKVKQAIANPNIADYEDAYISMCKDESRKSKSYIS